MRGFLILSGILAALLGWGFHVAPTADPAAFPLCARNE